ncbi:MAG: SRPBCC domain-containing protein [Pseudomonadota bacterium]
MNAERIDRAERDISVPAIEIYRAFLEPALLEKWLPPRGMGVKVHQIEPTEGGGYVMSLYHEEAAPAVAGKTSEREDRFRVVFDDLNPGHQIVQRVIFDVSDPSFVGVMKQTWRFVQDGQTTTVSVACENVPPGIRPEDHSVGLSSSLENLAAMLEQA